MTWPRQALYKGQRVSRVVANKSDSRWELYDDNGFLFGACPFASAIAPITDSRLSITPSRDSWLWLRPDQRELVNLVEMCLSRAPIPREWVFDFGDERGFFSVYTGSPWYTEPKLIPVASTTVSRSRKVAKARTEEPPSVSPLTARRFLRDGD